MSSFYQNRYLILQLTKRDILSRYRGSMAGMLWTFLHPLLMLIVYAFVFTYVFQARWGGNVEIPHTYFVLILYIGILMHGVVADCISKAPSLMLSHSNYIKKVVFPLEILPLVMLLSAAFQFLISFGIFLLAVIAVTDTLHFTAIYFVIIILPYFLVVYGISVLFSVFGVYFRDLHPLTSFLVTLLMFCSPIFYPVAILPERFQTILYFNPLTYFIEEVRNVVLWGNSPNWFHFSTALIAALLFAVTSTCILMRTKKGFADVI